MQTTEERHQQIVEQSAECSSAFSLGLDARALAKQEMWRAADKRDREAKKLAELRANLQRQEMKARAADEYLSVAQERNKAAFGEDTATAASEDME